MRCAKATAGQPLAFLCQRGWMAIVTEVPLQDTRRIRRRRYHRLRTAGTSVRAGEHQFGPFDGDLLRDDPLAEHEVAGTVDAVGGNELAGTEVEAGEVAVPGRVAAEDDLVVPGVETGDLELEVVLI